MPRGEGLTWPQVKYWGTTALLGLLGLALVVAAQFIGREEIRSVVSEFGVAILIAGILAGVVEPYFRKEFARDAFLAAFRYVLPTEFREEVEKILRFDFIAERQVWTVKVDKVSDEVVLVTTTYERTIRNKTKSSRVAKAWYEAEDYKFPNGSTTVECSIQAGDSDPLLSVGQDIGEHDAEAKTADLMIPPEGIAKVWGKGSQFRRTNDSMYENFRVPIINPEIEVIINEEEFSHAIAFGTHGGWTKLKYKNHYTLSGVYFPGQFMWVRWWPKNSEQASD